MGNISWIPAEKQKAEIIIEQNPNCLFRNINDITDEMVELINSVSPTYRDKRAILKKIDNTLQDRIGIRKNIIPGPEEYAEILALDAKVKGAIADWCHKNQRPRHQVDQIRTLAKKKNALIPATKSATTTIKSATEPATRPAKRKYNKHKAKNEIIATAGKVYCDASSPKKNFIQTLHYNRISFSKEEFVDRITTLLGPPVSWLKIHNIIRKYISSSSKILSFENNDIVGLEQLSRKSELLNTDIYPVDVSEAKGTQFMDIDFMQNLPTIKNTLINLFENQKNLYVNGKKKIFMFTFSLPSRKTLDTVIVPNVEDILSSLIGQTIKVNRFIEFNENFIDEQGQITSLKNLREYFVSHPNYKIIIYYYCDNTPMLNISIEHR